MICLDYHSSRGYRAERFFGFVTLSLTNWSVRYDARFIHYFRVVAPSKLEKIGVSR